MNRTMAPLFLNFLIMLYLNWHMDKAFGSFLLSDFATKDTLGICGCLYPGTHRHTQKRVGCAVMCGLSVDCKGFLFNKHTNGCMAVADGCSEQLDHKTWQDYEYHAIRKDQPGTKQS